MLFSYHCIVIFAFGKCRAWYLQNCDFHSCISVSELSLPFICREHIFLLFYSERPGDTNPAGQIFPRYPTHGSFCTPLSYSPFGYAVTKRGTLCPISDIHIVRTRTRHAGGRQQISIDYILPSCQKGCRSSTLISGIRDQWSTYFSRGLTSDLHGRGDLLIRLPLLIVPCYIRA